MSKWTRERTNSEVKIWVILLIQDLRNKLAREIRHRRSETRWAKEYHDKWIALRDEYEAFRKTYDLMNRFGRPDIDGLKAQKRHYDLMLDKITAEVIELHPDPTSIKYSTHSDR